MDIIAKYTNTLERAEDEAPLQKLFEKYSFPLLQQYCNAWNFYMAIPQFGLARDYIPDFLLVTAHSGMWELHFIELESPKAKVFNKDGSYARKLNIAMRQISDWAIWIDRNEQYLINSLADIVGRDFAFSSGMTPNIREGGRIRCQFHIIIGRRSVLSPDERARREYWSCGNGFGNSIASYDRLADSIRANPGAAGETKKSYDYKMNIRKVNKKKREMGIL